MNFSLIFILYISSKREITFFIFEPNEIFIPAGFDKIESEIPRQQMVKFWAKIEKYWKELEKYLAN